MNEKILISVIVPVYDVEKYLPKCIESILAQTLQAFELILIDDGSSDKCGVICEDYAMRDFRIKVFHKENGGVSSARNYGIERASGKYISFIDSDDWIENDMLQVLFELLTDYQADLAICGLQKEDEEGNILFKVETNVTYEENRYNTLLTLFNQDKYYKHQGWPVNKLYIKEIIDKYSLCFREDIYYSEDRLFLFHYLQHCSSAIFSTLPKYHYLIRQNSAMTASSSGNGYKDKYSTFMPAFEEMFQYASANLPLHIQSAIASNYTLDVVNLYLKYPGEIAALPIKTQIYTIVKRMLPYMSFYERSIYRLFLIHPVVYKIFIQCRLYLYLWKRALKNKWNCK